MSHIHNSVTITPALYPPIYPLVSSTDNDICPVDGIGSPTPHPQASVAPPTLGPRGEIHSLAGEEARGPNSDEGTALWYSMYSILFIPLRAGYSGPG
jgi:hypothetical protein